MAGVDCEQVGNAFPELVGQGRGVRALGLDPLSEQGSAESEFPAAAPILFGEKGDAESDKADPADRPAGDDPAVRADQADVQQAVQAH